MKGKGDCEYVNKLQPLNKAKMSSSEVELVKELVFGAAFGACAGYVSKKLGSKFVAGKYDWDALSAIERRGGGERLRLVYSVAACATQVVLKVLVHRVTYIHKYVRKGVGL